MHRIHALLLAAALALASPAAIARQDAPPPRTPLSLVTLEQIMSDPDWIARSPERPYWADDGSGVYFLRKREGSEARDLWRADVRIVGDHYEFDAPRQLSEKERALADERSGALSDDRQWKVFSRGGDLLLKHIRTGALVPLTRTSAGEFGARFLVGDSQVAFQRDGATLVRDLKSGLESQPVDLRFAKDPDDEKDKPEKPDYLAAQQERLFETVRRTKEQREEAKARAKEERNARADLAPPIVYLPEDLELRSTSLSPSAQWMLVRAARKAKDGKRDTMPSFVTDDGYVKTSPVRPKVGVGERRGEELFLIDLRPGIDQRQRRLDLAALPGITDNPLDALKPAPAPTDAQDTPAPPDTPEKAKRKDPTPRPVSIRSIEWNDDGSRVVVQAFSLDNKDRWIALVDLDEAALEPLEREQDEAWINGRFASLGWLKDNRTIWYLSEKSGFSQLYALDLGERLSGLGGGRLLSRLDDAAPPFEVSDVSLSRDGSFLFFSANAQRPGVSELYRVPTSGAGLAQRLTSLGGQNDFALSPDEQGVAVLHSTTTAPPELYLARFAGAPPARVTHTVSSEYAAIDWIEPRVVAIPGREGRSIWTRVYEAQDADLDAAPRPCVVFVHGAGYLQDAHEGWSHYFREHMFHNLLAARGYIVAAPDYRASAGYGRDWRTAIYRRMGAPELDDVEDCIAHLARDGSIDTRRVGIYGGSYGGFLTLMAMFTRPGSFACGAALRPVTDWAHYNDGYTANILNTPETDPEAYERSSPIEHAQGLAGPLLICHGMLDDNVLFEDTVRLAQRLIELKKERWEVAAYPVEAHAFREATSWLDEYRRIDRLFREHLEGRR